LTDDGALELEEFGQETDEKLWDVAYPELVEVRYRIHMDISSSTSKTAEKVMEYGAEDSELSVPLTGVVVIDMQTDTDPDGVSRAAPTNHDHPVANRELLDDERLATIVSTLGDLPVLPDITLRALRLAEDPEWDLKELTGTIGRDQGLAAEFLRLANSAFFGGTGTISTLDRAICRVGNTRVQSILLATVLEGFHATTQSNFTGTMLWEHALVTATVSRHLAPWNTPQSKVEVLATTG
jgi:hypothetical protein